jgi:hypothetical protein
VEQPSELQASFSNGTATYKAYATSELDQHWAINNMEFDAQSNKQAMLLIPTELLDASNQTVSATTLSVILQPGNQRIKFLENEVMIGLLTNKRGNYTISMVFSENEKKVGELKIPVLVGATGTPIIKSVKVEALNIAASQQRFTHGCTTMIHCDFDLKAENTGNTEVYGKVITDVFLEGQKVGTETADYISLLLSAPKSSFSSTAIPASFPTPVSGGCYAGKTVKLEMKFVDDEGETIGTGTAETQITQAS